MLYFINAVLDRKVLMDVCFYPITSSNPPSLCINSEYCCAVAFTINSKLGKKCFFAISWLCLFWLTWKLLDKLWALKNGEPVLISLFFFPEANVQICCTWSATSSQNIMFQMAVILMLPFRFKWCQHSFHMTKNLVYIKKYMPKMSVKFAR